MFVHVVAYCTINSSKTYLSGLNSTYESSHTLLADENLDAPPTSLRGTHIRRHLCSVVSVYQCLCNAVWTD